jgi:hypothetical protein
LRLGYGIVYFVDDHFLLQPKRIEAICTGINDAGVTISPSDADSASRARPSR